MPENLANCGRSALEEVPCSEKSQGKVRLRCAGGQDQTCIPNPYTTSTKSFPSPRRGTEIFFCVPALYSCHILRSKATKLFLFLLLKKAGTINPSFLSAPKSSCCVKFR